jgi:hypothetical protein
MGLLFPEGVSNLFAMLDSFRYRLLLIDLSGYDSPRAESWDEN